MNDMLNTLTLGEEYTFSYKDNNYSVYVTKEEDSFILFLDYIYGNPYKTHIWDIKGGSISECINTFKDTKIFRGKSFLEIKDHIS